VTRTTLFLWGMLLAIAPAATAVVTWEHRDDVWVISSASGVAAAAVVVLFAFVAGRAL
jgi:hypothetical protein